MGLFPSSSSSGKDQGNRGSNCALLYLNIYDLTPINNYLYWFGLGIFHSGIEVLWCEIKPYISPGNRSSALQHERTPDLFQILGLEKKIRKFICFLIKKKHLLQAIRYIYAFDKVDRFPPIQLLKDHVDYSISHAKKLCEEGHLSQSEATKEEIDDLRATIKCIADYKLDSEYSPTILEEHIALLEKQNEDEKGTKPAPASNSQSNKCPRTEISTGDSPNTRVRTSSAVYLIQPSTPTTIHSMQPPQQPESMSTNQGASYPSTTAQQQPEGVFTNQGASYPSTTPQQQQPGSMFTDHGAYPSITALQLQPAGMFTNQGASYPNITPHYILSDISKGTSYS